MIDVILGYIDLSKRRVSPDDASKCEEKFARGKTVCDFFIHFSRKIKSF